MLGDTNLSTFNLFSTQNRQFHDVLPAGGCGDILLSDGSVSAWCRLPEAPSVSFVYLVSISYGIIYFKRAYVSSDA